MASRPRIGVTGAARRFAPSWWCTRLALFLAGATAVRISVRHRPEDDNFDGLIIGGGNDIGPEHYGGDLEAQVKLDPDRDELEIAWIKRALSENLPLLGICRGAQLINVVLGGTLHADLRLIRHHTYNRPGLLPTKLLRVDDDSRLKDLFEKTNVRVNSLHHQAVKEPGEGLRPVAWDRDDIVQAIEPKEDRPVLGVQWHPEYLFYLPVQFALFRWLVRRRP